MNIDSVSLVKVKNGEIYIGQIDKDNNQLNEAYLIQIIPTGQQSFNIMMMPAFAPINKECVTIYNIRNEALAISEPNEDLKKQYIAARTNILIGSTTPNNQPLIGG